MVWSADSEHHRQDTRPIRQGPRSRSIKMKTKFPVFLASFLMFFIWPNKPVFAFNPITDIRNNVVWTFGQSAQAGEGYDFSAKKWDKSALAEIAQYRFLSLSYGATLLDSTSDNATDTVKLGFLSSFFFKLFTHQPTPQMAWMQNLNVGPSFAVPVFSGVTGHKGVFLLDLNYRFSGQ
jgi:hypothetical protein